MLEAAPKQWLPASVFQHKQHRWMTRAVQLEFELWSQTIATKGNKGSDAGADARHEP